MTEPDDSTADGDAEGNPDPSDQGSSLEDLAKSISGSRGSELPDSEVPDIDLDVGEDESEGDEPFDWFDAEMDGAAVTSAGVPNAIETAANVLVLGPARGADSDRSCIDLLTTRPVDGTDVLFVTITQSADDRIATWQRHTEGTPASLIVVSFKNDMRSAGTSTTISTRGGPDHITVESLSDPSDLTRLGIALSKHLSETATGDSRTALCVHSLTALLQYVDSQRLFRFLHILQGRLEAHDTVAHYHMDPDAHESEDLRVFESLFDAVVRLGDDGRLTVVSAPK